MLRIAHYNIFRGGDGRIKKILNVIKEMNPDIIGILEAVDWHNKETEYKNIFKKIGYKFLKVGKANSRHNIAVISKFPIDASIFKKNLRHVTVKVNIKNKVISNFNLLFVHLSHLSEIDRLKEIKQILKYATKNTIIMGDLNSLSNEDPYNRKELFSKFKKRGIKKYGIKSLQFSVIKELQKNGFVDAMTFLNKPFKVSVPTLLNNDPDHEIPIRIDYAFVSKPLTKNIKNIKILKNKKTEQASDHYPLFIDLGK